MKESHIVRLILGALGLLALVTSMLGARGDVLYQGTKAIALGKGKRDKNLIH